MEITSNVKDQIVTAKIVGNLLGEKDAKPILDVIEGNIEQGNKQFILLLEELKYINSTGLSVLITSLTKSRNAGGELYIVTPSPQLDNLLKITKLDSVFSRANSEEEAKEKLTA
ncbi:MAG: STAS domain-containing protein [Chitinophagales bacterium]